MAVMLKHARCERCGKSGMSAYPIMDDDPYCYVCMDEINKDGEFVMEKEEASKMDFKKNAEAQSSSELYYDLFEGGYIDVEALLEEEDAKKVNEAVSLIRRFLNEAEELGLIELY